MEYYTTLKMETLLNVTHSMLLHVCCAFNIKPSLRQISKKPGNYYTHTDFLFLKNQLDVLGLRDKFEKEYQAIIFQKRSERAPKTKKRRTKNEIIKSITEHEQRTFSDKELEDFNYVPHKILQSFKQLDGYYHIIYQDCPTCEVIELLADIEYLIIKIKEIIQC